MAALVYVIRPEWRIHQPHVLHRHVLAVRDIRQARTLRILVGTLRIPLATNPELLPIRQTVTVYRTLARNGKPSSPSASTSAQKYVHVSPSMRVFI